MQPSTATANVDPIDVPMAPELARSYYVRSFPTAEVCAFLCRSSGMALTGRRLGFDATGSDRKSPFHVRQHNFDDSKKLAAFLTKPELFCGQVHVGPFKADDNAVPRRELVFDIDLDCPRWNAIRKDMACGCAEKTKVCCDLCWRLVAGAVTILQQSLRANFGFTEFMPCFSGRRGVHLWVLDEACLDLPWQAREAIVSFYTLGPAQAQVKPDTAYSWIDSKDRFYFEFGPSKSNYFNIDFSSLVPFAKVVIDRMLLAPAASTSCLSKLLAPFPLAVRPVLESRLAAAAKAAKGGFDRLRETIVAINQEHLKQRKFELVESTERAWNRLLLSIFWPELDAQVTKNPEHLIRCPLSLHSSSRKFCLPLLFSTDVPPELKTTVSFDSFLPSHLTPLTDSTTSALVKEGAKVLSFWTLKSKAKKKTTTVSSASLSF